MCRGQDTALQEDFVQESSATMFGILTGTYDLISEYFGFLNLSTLLPPLTPESVTFMKDALDTSDRAGIDDIGENIFCFLRVNCWGTAKFSCVRIRLFTINILRPHRVQLPISTKLQFL